MRRWIWKILLAVAVTAALTGSAMAEDTIVTENGIKYNLSTGTVVGPVSKDNIVSITIRASVNGNDITSIAPDAFNGCGKLTTVTMESGIQTVGSSAFNSCTLLQSVLLPDTIVTIGDYAFANCGKLDNVVLPTILKDINTGTFANCSSLKSIYIADVGHVYPGAFSGSGVTVLHSATKAGLKQDDTPGLTVHATTRVPGVKTEPTCVLQGNQAYSYNCGEGCGSTFNFSQNRPIPANGHKQGEEIPAVEATCSQTGTEAGHRCSVCGGIADGLEVIPINPNNHVSTPVEIPAVSPTCEEPGLTEGARCPDCLAITTKQEEIPKLNHDFDPSVDPVEETIDSTCLEAGKIITRKHCTICGQDIVTDEKALDLAPCKYDEGKQAAHTIAEASCAHPGITVTYRVCDVCGKTEKCEECEKIEEALKKPEAKLEEDQSAHLEMHGPVVETDPLKHTRPDDAEVDEVNSVPATCTKPGKTVYQDYPCAVCGETVTGDTADLEATGHNYEPEGEPEYTPPTCTEPGVTKTTYVCTNENCDGEPDEAGHGHRYVKTDETKAAGHQWGDFTDSRVTKEPTCEAGTAVGTARCKVCDAEATGIEIELAPVADHQWGEWADAEEAGKQVQTCSVCGKTRERTSTSTPAEDPEDPDDKPDDSKPGDSSPGTSTPGTSADSTHTVSVISASNGTVTASAYSAKQGDRITLTVRPNSGYELDWVRVTTSSGAIRPLDGLGSGQYSFTMPNGSVEVRSSFVQAYTPSWSTDAAASTGATSRWTDPAQTAVQSVPRAGAASQIFSDIPLSHWAAGEINWASQMGYMNGSRGRFDPDGTITFQQLWMVLARVSGSRPANMTEARNWAVLNGFADGGNPGHTVARHQLVTALYRCAHVMGSTNQLMASLAGYPDSRTVPSVARDPMAWAVANGIISGNANGRLEPYGTLTRAQFAVILYRFSQRI